MMDMYGYNIIKWFCEEDMGFGLGSDFVKRRWGVRLRGFLCRRYSSKYRDNQTFGILDSEVFEEWSIEEEESQKKNK